MHFVMAVLTALAVGAGPQAHDFHHGYCYYHPGAYVCHTIHHGSGHPGHRLPRLHGGHH